MLVWGWRYHYQTFPPPFFLQLGYTWKTILRFTKSFSDSTVIGSCIQEVEDEYLLNPQIHLYNINNFSFYPIG
jgi:hypothetical protein